MTKSTDWVLAKLYVTKIRIFFVAGAKKLTFGAKKIALESGLLNVLFSRCERLAKMSKRMKIKLHLAT